MRRGLVWSCFFFVLLQARAGQLPLTAKEVGLMLRAGYSNASMMQELAKRHFADKLDSEKESLLIKAGASEELISALNGGAYSVSPQDAAQFQKQVAEREQRKAVAAENAHKAEILYQEQRERRRRSIPPAGPNPIYEAVKEDLVRLSNGSVVHSDDDELANKKLIAIYFSAHWCGPCRKFTPDLVAFYNRVAPQHPEFEVLFCSNDRSAAEMQNYMREANMPWPAIAYEKVAAMGAITKYAGSGIPCLVLVDAAGRVVSDSFKGSQYVGPGKVLNDADHILSSSDPNRFTLHQP